MTQTMQEVLAEIAGRFNREGLLWGAGASLVLFHFGLQSLPKDIDLFVSSESWERAEKILRSLGSYEGARPSDIFPSRFFAEFSVRGIGVDLICGFRIRHKEGIYEYFFDESSLSSRMEVLGQIVPICSPEEWLLLYALMPGREEKHKKLRCFLRKEGCKSERIRKSLEQSLPRDLRAISEELIEELI